MVEVPKLDPREQHFRISSDHAGLNLFLRHLGPPATSHASEIVLYIHGATFPSALSIAHRFDGHSWRDALNAAGFHVWGLDFLGYGGSDRYLEMSQSPKGQPPLGRASECSRQIERAARFIIQYHHAERISLIAHSWGTMAAGLFAGNHPELVERMVFFAPIAQRAGQPNAVNQPGWNLVSIQEQWNRFIEDVPATEPAVLSRSHFDEWASRYLDSDPESRTRSPASVKVPGGPVQEIAEAFAGQLAYDPATIRAPVAIIRGAWDHLVTDADAAWLFDALKNSPIKRDVKICRGTHLLHLERNRYALYRETQTFLEGRDEPVELCAKETLAVKNEKKNKGTTMITAQMTSKEIPGYDFGTGQTPESPVTMNELRKLEEAVGWTEEDLKWLRVAAQTLVPKAEEMVDAWRAIIGRQPQLLASFLKPDGRPDDAYKAAVKRRFVQWVSDICLRDHDQDWLNYQEEIGKRHTPVKKNKTDNGHTPPVVPLRYLIGFSSVVITSVRSFLISSGRNEEDLQRMQDAWARAVLLSITLWARAYLSPELW